MSMITPTLINTQILNVSFSSGIENRLTTALNKNFNELSSEVDKITHSLEDNPNSIYSWKELTDWVIKNNCIKVLQNAIQHKEISRESVEQIFSYSAMHCAESDYQKTLLLLINSSNFCKVSDDNLSGAFQCMLQRGQLEVVKAILNTTRDKEKYLRPNFFYCTLIQKLASHEALCNQGILLDILDTVFTWAVENSHRDFIQTILENSSFKKEGEQKTFKGDLQNRCKESVLDHILSGKIHDGAKEILLDTALSSGCAYLVDIFIGEN